LPSPVRHKILQLKGALKAPIHQVVRTVFRMDPGYDFRAAPSIKEQSFAFEYKGSRLSLTCDHTSPLYDTIGEIVDYDCYQLGQVDFSNSANALVLDVGAHIGTASLVLSRLHHGTILCFEPVPENCRFLQMNLEANHVANAVIVRAAITGEDGFAEFEVNPNSGVAGHAAGIMAADPKTFSRSLRVKSVTLRTALAEFPNQPVHLIKMDCEGGEYSIVDQITPDLLPRIRNMTFEVHDLDGTRNVRVLTEKLKRLGFRVYYKKEMYNRRALHHLLATAAR
jgi:FkbM family methyltransferase